RASGSGTGTPLSAIGTLVNSLPLGTGNQKERPKTRLTDAGDSSKWLTRTNPGPNDNCPETGSTTRCGANHATSCPFEERKISANFAAKVKGNAIETSSTAINSAVVERYGKYPT